MKKVISMGVVTRLIIRGDQDHLMTRNAIAHLYKCLPNDDKTKNDEFLI